MLPSLNGLGIGTVAVAVDEDKSSEKALRWATDNLLSKGQTVSLVHVNPLPPNNLMGNNDERQEPDDQHKDLFLPFRVFCSRREVLWKLVTLQELDIAKALIEYVLVNRVETLVLGCSSKRNISRLFGKSNVATSVLKGAPDFCTVYLISKGKISSMRSAPRPLRPTAERLSHGPERIIGGRNSISSLPGPRPIDNRMHDEYSVASGDISFVSSGRLSTDSMLFAFYDNLGGSQEFPQRHKKSSSVNCSSNFDPFFLESKLASYNPSDDELPSNDEESKCTLASAQNIDDMEEKMRRLDLEMKQTMEMYHAACKEALREKEKAKKLLVLRAQDEIKLKDALRAKEEALAIAEEEKTKCKKATEAANAAQREAEQEAQKRISAERELETKIKLEREIEAKIKLDSLHHSNSLPRHQSFLHIVVVLSVFYLYFVTWK